MIRLRIKQAALEKAREKKIQNPSQLAAEAGISRSMATAAWNATAISPDRSNGTQRLPDLRTLWKIAKALNCDLSDLVRFVGTKASRPGQS